MPVKRTIRRKQSTLLDTLAWIVKPARRQQHALRAGMGHAMRAGMRAVRTHVVKPFARLTSSMDKSTMAAALTTGAMIVALLVAGYRTMPAQFDGASADAQAAVHEDSGIATPTTVRAVADARTPASTTQVRAAAPEVVTIAGCLAQDGDTFRLKDTSGADAPRSRSWKTGFLMKSAASVDVVDASNRLKLTRHVGQRVSVTGKLVDGEMQVRSLRRVASSCSDEKPKVNA